jgi:elongator complex protein 3
MPLRPPPNISPHRQDLSAIIEKILQQPALTEKNLRHIIKKHPKNKAGLFGKDEILHAYRCWHLESDWPWPVEAFSAALAKKPIRTASGVVPVTVLTMPHPCPGQCIFCPNDVRMPKSYVSSEPGCRRAAENRFDPYWQVRSRLLAYARYGHNPQKVELIILGGTWASYPKTYRRWFIERCFAAMNGFNREDQPNLPNEQPGIQDRAADLRRGNYNQLVTLHSYSGPSDWDLASDETLAQVHEENESADIRCVGLSVETRPESVTEEELIFARQLGITKFQIGVQTTDDAVLEKNQRGHSLDQTKHAFALLRRMGFKIQAHWMLNLYGVEIQDEVPLFKRLFEDEGLRPDELKIYPCVLLEDTVLWDIYEKGHWQPYSSEELVGLISEMMAHVPPYVRVSRVIRDFPADDIVAGNKKGNLREDIDKSNLDMGRKVREIRSREIGLKDSELSQISFKAQEYQTAFSKEFFLSAVTDDDDLLGFLRLSIPAVQVSVRELQNSAIIREVHVYGRSKSWEHDGEKGTQHKGLGHALLGQAVAASRKRGFTNLAVISAVGTKGYYRRFGFGDGILYQHHDLSSSIAAP